MTEKQTFAGMPIRTAGPKELRDAVMNGEFLHRAGECAFYMKGGKVFVVEADKPIWVGTGRGSRNEC